MVQKRDSLSLARLPVVAADMRHTVVDLGLPGRAGSRRLPAVHIGFAAADRIGPATGRSMWGLVEELRSLAVVVDSNLVAVGSFGLEHHIRRMRELGFHNRVKAQESRTAAGIDPAVDTGCMGQTLW